MDFSSIAGLEENYILNKKGCIEKELNREGLFDTRNYLANSS